MRSLINLEKRRIKNNEKATRSGIANDHVQLISSRTSGYLKQVSIARLINQSAFHFVRRSSNRVEELTLIRDSIRSRIRNLGKNPQHAQSSPPRD